MGLFKKLHERSQAKIEKARQEGYTKALQSGASEEEARAEGDKAARRQKRRQAAIMGAVNS
ncbi:hypothetical protein [Luteipulveratus mongoliensis]|nr:hypothetical protein [Luteipulveratus mongoliensis]